MATCSISKITKLISNRLTKQCKTLPSPVTFCLASRSKSIYQVRVEIHSISRCPLLFSQLSIRSLFIKLSTSSRWMGASAIRTPLLPKLLTRVSAFFISLDPAHRMHRSSISPTSFSTRTQSTIP